SRWRHFEVGNIPRLAELNQKLAELTPVEKAKTKFDLAVISVLLDAGAGANWDYCEPETGLRFCRSEGLAIASFRMFCEGAFSSDPNYPLQADAQALQTLTVEKISQGFQVSPTNLLLGLDGRIELLKRLGQSLQSTPEMFGKDNSRPGNLVNYLLNNFIKEGERGRGEEGENFSSATPTELAASQVLTSILEGLGNIWPGRLAIANVNLGDVWFHSALEGDKISDHYVPFHKLSQWLTYSLLEPLQELDIKITGLDELTGLAEYRNGGLMVDLGLIKVKDSAILQQRHLPGSEVIVEWRALTVSLLDRIAAVIRQQLNLSAEELPLVKVLQGGTWTAGRRIAGQLRKGGVPPIQIESDGTVF
ncbi:MAG TPA: DUF1688 domain-containing protein, partial [Cyanobacteria bacterium UBA11162]|nr:DUF1688 domain-containing protein [Cyanobacteria bacterium UBA11162]